MEEMEVTLQEQEQEQQDHTDEKNVLYTERMNLEAQLQSTDYKVIKCMEAQAAGMDMPYDIVALRNQRQAWRNRMTAIDAEIQVLDGYEPTEEELLERAKAVKLGEIAEYDVSANVNAFTVNGQPMWLGFEQRSRLKASVEAAVSAGQQTMEKWFGGIRFVYPVEVWQQMITAVENYAGQCLNITDAHKSAVEALTTVADVEAFDITVGYPNKLAF